MVEFPSSILIVVAMSTCCLLLPAAPPVVTVYSQQPGAFDEANTLICHVSNFHPPDITIQLMNGNEEIAPANQTDLAFGKDWHFYLTRSANFIPKEGDTYTCRVTHGKVRKDYIWGEI